MNDWKNVLVAVADTPTSNKGLEYAANILGQLEGVQTCLLHIYPEPPPDYYSSGGSLADYKEQQHTTAAALLDRSTAVRIDFVLPEQAISRDIQMAEQKTISQTILDVQEEGKFGTVVVGKRGLSKAEEFLFGSISNALVHHTRNCTVWVVG